MSILIRSAVSLALAGACAATAASQPAPRAAARDLVSRYNAAGQPVVDAQGRHINYGREAWKHGDWSGSSKIGRATRLNSSHSSVSRMPSSA